MTSDLDHSNLTIERTTELTDDDKRSLWGWGDDIFQTRDYGLEWRPKEIHLIARNRDGLALSKVSLLRHIISVEGAPLTIGGVGGVVTIPAAQRQHLAKLLLERANAVMREEFAVDFGFLFCLEHMRPYYAARGWKEISSAVVIEQSTGERISPIGAMSLALAGASFPAGEVRLQSIPW